MTELEKTQNRKVINAIDYIKNSTIFTNSRYKWITPLITKTLEDSLCDTDINDLVDSLLSRKKSKDKQAQQTQSEDQIESDAEENEDVGIKIIKSIDKISNIGLLNIEEPIVLKDGLNVFYGKNGAGKSSIYLGLCKVLGKNKSICSNIATESDESCCVITFGDDDCDDYTLEWDSEDENEESKVMIFDSLISSYIVEQPQENQFKMAHLKMEYFSFLHNLYQKIESKLDQELSTINTKYLAISEVLEDKFPTVFEDDFDWDKKKIKKFSLTKKNKEDLVELNRRIKILEKDNPESVVQNISNALEEIKSILSVFGETNEEEDEKGDVKYSWELYYDKEYFDGVNTQIDNYNKIKKAFEKSGINKISSYIPLEWINKDTWKDFISSSIDFFNSLDTDEAKKYTEEKCAYCHQLLQTKEAKALIKAYQELHDEHKEKLNKEASELKEMSEAMEECIEAINGLFTKNEKIEKEFESIGKKGQIAFDYENLIAVFQKYKTAIDEAKKVEIKDADIKMIEKFWNIYEALSYEFEVKINSLNKSIENKDEKIEKLRDKVEPLEEKKSLYENKKNILQYLKLQGLEEVLNEKISCITTLRQVTSSLKTSFTNKATLKEFKKYLKKEYEFFDFSPPETWTITPATRSDVNKRVYSIGDKHLAEIFSEGEKKLHALSDFFAQCELDKYRGVYVFDDPVNSLDEDNIEMVAERIIKLVEDGNQVIVFTHNLYFLNSIINTQKEKITKVERNHSQINLLKEVNIGETQELKERLKKIDSKMTEFSKKKPGEINEYDMRNVYDLISGYLEDYTEKVYFKNVISRYRPNIRMESLGDLKDLDTSVIDDVLKLYKRTSRRGSRHSQPGGVKKPKYEELIKDVKTLKDSYKWN